MSTANKNNNSTSIPLKSGTEFVGLAQSTTGFSNILVNIRTDKKAELTIQQSADKVNWDLHSLWTCDPAKSPTGFLVQEPASLPFFRVKLLNTSGENMIRLRLISVLNLTSNVKLNVRQDNTLVSGEDALGEKRTLLTDASGALVIGGTTPSGTLNVNVTNDVVVQGQNNNYEFYPTPTNNTSAVYADGTAGVDVAGGWSYSNIATGKINWYLYGSTGLATDYKVSQLNSMYAVVNNQSTLGLALAQNPWVMIYTRPDSGTNGAGWYKSKLFFGSNAHTDISGIKLLYTGSDPVGVHPEITGINRIQLLFVEALSTKPLAEAQNENIMLGSLQTTNNTAQAGAFNFVMQEFGADWVKTPSILPIEFNKVVCDVTGTVTTIKPALITQTQLITSPTAGLASSSFDLGNNSLFDCLLLASGTIIAGNVRLDYSIDNVNWFPDNTATSQAALSTADPHFVYRGISSASRYVRVSSGSGSLFSATSLRVTFSSKLN